jgi:hypothetical protein
LPTKLKYKGDEIILDFSGECENIILKPSDAKDFKTWKEILEQVINYQAK